MLQFKDAKFEREGIDYGMVDLPNLAVDIEEDLRKVETLKQKHESKHPKHVRNGRDRIVNIHIAHEQS